MKYCLDCGNEKSNKGLYCKKCGYSHRVRPRGLVYIKHKENPTSFKKGTIPWNKGKPSKLMKKNPGYDALHEWVERWVGKPKVCEFCGSTKNMQIANRSGKYLREFSDWLMLCTKCHQRYDYEHFGARKAFYR